MRKTNCNFYMLKISWNLLIMVSWVQFFLYLVWAWMLESIIIVCLIDWFCHFWKRGLYLPRIQFQPKVIAVIWMSLIVKSCQRGFFDISWKNPKFSASMETSITNVVWPCSSTSSIYICIHLYLLSWYMPIFNIAISFI